MTVAHWWSWCPKERRTVMRWSVDYDHANAVLQARPRYFARLGGLRPLVILHGCRTVYPKSQPATLTEERFLTHDCHLPS